METNEDVLRRIKNLLRLAQSDNEHEAALAASRAQELMDRHKIEQSMLELDTSKPAEPDEDIVHFDDADDALDNMGSKATTWKGSLAQSIAMHNGCEVYYNKRRRDTYEPREVHLAIVGRPSDVATVRYLYAYCVKEIERFVAQQGAGHGRTWYNNYRMGCVAAMADKLHEQRKAMFTDLREEATTAASGTALVKVNSAIAKFEEKKLATREWVKKNMKLRTTSTSYAHNNAAYTRGKKDGATINLSGGKALGGGERKRLGK